MPERHGPILLQLQIDDHPKTEEPNPYTCIYTTALDRMKPSGRDEDEEDDEDCLANTHGLGRLSGRFRRQMGRRRMEALMLVCDLCILCKVTHRKN